MGFVFCIIYKFMCECGHTHSTITYFGEEVKIYNNWHGELHRLWTTAESKVITRLARKLDRTRRSVLVYFNDASKANWEIKGE